MNYFSLISYQRRKMLENYFFVFSSTSQSVENYFFMVPYQRRKMLHSCFSDFSSTRQIGAKLLLFDFSPTPQNAGELFLQKYFFLTSYQRCKMLKNYVFGFLSALQSVEIYFFMVPYQRRKMLQSCFSDFSSTRQIGAELLLFDFLPTPQNAGE